MLPLSCSCSLAREDVSFPNFGGAKAPLVAQRRLNAAPNQKFWWLDTSSDHCCSVALTFSAPHHACTGRPHIHVYSHPTPSHGPHSRCPCHARAFRHVTMCRARAPGRPVVSPLNCSLLPWLPIHPGQLEPTTLPQRRLAPDSCSVGLSPILSLSLSLLPSLSLSLSLLLSVPLPLRPTLSLSLSRIKGVFGTFGGSLSPSGFEPSSTGQKRCGIPTELRRVVLRITCSDLSYSPLRVIPCQAYRLSHGGVLSRV